MEAHDRTEVEANGEIVVFSILKPSACAECGVELWKGSFLRMEQGKALCLECADLGHLVFIPRGDAALTRRSRKYSALSAVVVRFSRSRRRYERQGLLVESGALERAEEECLGDEAKRRIAREKAALAREQADQQYVVQFTESIRSRYPDCPPAERIATHSPKREEVTLSGAVMAEVSWRVGLRLLHFRIDQIQGLAVHEVQYIHDRLLIALLKDFHRGVTAMG